MSSYQKVKASKLSFKGGLDPKIDKKKKKKKKKDKKGIEGYDGEEERGDGGEDEAGTQRKEKQKKSKGGEATEEEEEEDFEIDRGIGHAPDGGKKTKLYEDMFPVETKRFGYETEKKNLSREEALDIRVKKKADRYCK